MKIIFFATLFAFLLGCGKQHESKYEENLQKDEHASVMNGVMNSAAVMNLIKRTDSILIGSYEWPVLIKYNGKEGKGNLFECLFIIRDKNEIEKLGEELSKTGKLGFGELILCDGLDQIYIDKEGNPICSVLTQIETNHVSVSTNVIVRIGNSYYAFYPEGEDPSEIVATGSNPLYIKLSSQITIKMLSDYFNFFKL